METFVWDVSRVVARGVSAEQGRRYKKDTPSAEEGEVTERGHEDEEETRVEFSLQVSVCCRASAKACFYAGW